VALEEGRGNLIKLLALARGHRLHREQAMEYLWPGLDPEAAANNWETRKASPPPLPTSV